MSKHIEIECSSLAECYARVRELITISDLGHKARIVIDIDTKSKFDGSYIQVPDLSETLPGTEECEGTPGKDYVPVDWVETLERFGKWKIVPAEEAPVWRRIKAGEKIPCRAYLHKLAYERQNNFGGKATIDGLLIPNEPVTCGCDTWYLPVDQIKNLPKEGENE